MEITQLKLTKRGDRVSVFVDKEFTLAVGRNLIVDFNLYEGKKLSNKELDKIKRKEFYVTNYVKVLNLIARRPRSEKEVRGYLEKKIDRDVYDVIESIIEKLKNEKYIDDLSFSKWWIKNRLQFKPRGKFLISFELKQKGVAKEIIDRAFKGEFSESKEIRMAKELVKKVSGRYSRLKSFDRKMKIFAFLSRKGFNYKIIKSALN